MIIGVSILIALVLLAFGYVYMIIDRLCLISKDVASHAVDAAINSDRTRKISTENFGHITDSVNKQIKVIEAQNEVLVKILRHFVEREKLFQTKLETVEKTQSELQQISENLFILAEKHEKTSKT